MTKLTVLILFLSCHSILLLSQRPTTQLESLLEVYDPVDTFSVYIGKDVGKMIDTLSERYNTYVGNHAGAMSTTGERNSFFGDRSGSSNIDGADNSFYGHKSGTINQSGSFNSIFGALTGESLSTGDNNCFFGWGAGRHTKSGDSNVFIGFDAGTNNDSTSFQTFVGTGAGRANTSGTFNTFVGGAAGTSNLNGGSNTFIGFQSGLFNTAGSGNTYVGLNAGYSTDEGNDNTFIGLSAGTKNVNGEKNTYVGAFTANDNFDGEHNVFIGYGAGLGEAGSNKLYIESLTTGLPLIYGDFVQDSVVVNGDLTVTGTLNHSSDKNLKEKIVQVDYDQILTRLKKMPISYWYYKGKDERHIGPMAQDVYAIFDVGERETAIATVDSDGIALAAIKALIFENESLKKQNEIISKELEILKSTQKKIIEKLEFLNE